MTEKVNAEYSNTGKHCISSGLVQQYTQRLAEQGYAMKVVAADTGKLSWRYCEQAVDAFINRKVRSRGVVRTKEIDNTVLAVYNHGKTPEEKSVRNIAKVMKDDFGIQMTHETVRQILKQNGVERMKKPRKKKEPELTETERLVIDKFNSPLPDCFKSRGKWSPALISTELWNDRTANLSASEVEEILKKHNLI